jgi:succinate-semialdehyde dehydrogenase/glutarate-semialdehyde dehydrogenase
MGYQSVNPADGKALKTFEELTDKELEGKIAAAAACFQTWRLKTYLVARVIRTAGTALRA